ncbi:hypothetical protein [Sulfurovum sp.]|uniref:hypothetical protein n=1 Tax=Sulfurovum sp. TaxID=1969726 RepID=UPI0025D0B88B|nr:hypothetical protein [Sulfurovum sp.]
MKKLLTFASILALTSLFAHANDMEKVKSTITMAAQDTTQAAPGEEPQVPKTKQDDKNSSEKDQTENK